MSDPNPDVGGQPTIDEVITAYKAKHHCKPAATEAAPAVSPPPCPPDTDVFDEDEDEVGPAGNH